MPRADCDLKMTKGSVSRGSFLQRESAGNEFLLQPALRSFIYAAACATITMYGHIQDIADFTHIGAGDRLRLGPVPAGALVHQREEPRR